MLSNAAFNAFLKTLEEPPSYAIFVLQQQKKIKLFPQFYPDVKFMISIELKLQIKVNS